LRYEAYLLSKLSTISAIRGQAVDDALGERLVPALNRGLLPECEHIKAAARERLTEMLEFAKEHQMVERLAQPDKLPDHFTMLFENEYGEGVNSDEIERAYSEVDSSIENLYGLNELLETLTATDYIITQRALTWKIGENSVRAVPDVVAFCRDQPPIVLDWKVHFFANADAARQLASYSLALARANPHRDFPFSSLGWSEAETRLLEAQLLKGEVREFDYSEDDYKDLEQWITSQIMEISLALHGRKKSNEFGPEDFPAAFDGRPCQRCNFKKLCWNQELA